MNLEVVRRLPGGLGRYFVIDVTSCILKNSVKSSNSVRCPLRSSLPLNHLLKHLRHVSLCLFVFAGCSESSQPSAPPRTAGEVILSCVESSGQKLDAAQAAGDIAIVAREIAQVLDDYEDSSQMAPFEEFHRQIEQLERLAAKQPTGCKATDCGRANLKDCRDQGIGRKVNCGGPKLARSVISLAGPVPCQYSRCCSSTVSQSSSLRN